jgi:hypothetical protein
LFPSVVVVVSGGLVYIIFHLVPCCTCQLLASSFFCSCCPHPNVCQLLVQLSVLACCPAAPPSVFVSPCYATFTRHPCGLRKPGSTLAPCHLQCCALHVCGRPDSELLESCCQPGCVPQRRARLLPGLACSCMHWGLSLSVQDLQDLNDIRMCRDRSGPGVGCHPVLCV